METPLFDTRHAADTLVAGGIQQDHANAIVTMLDECLHGTVAKTSDLNEVKAELNEVKAELKADIAEVKAELKADIAEVKAELTTMRSDFEARIVQQANKTILAVIAAAGVIVTVIKLF